MACVGDYASAMTNLATIDDLSTYSPEEAGAECERCPLRDERAKGRFAPPELRPSAIQLHVAEAPGKVEIELHRPLVGPSGAEHARAILAAKGQRRNYSLTNCMLCRPPGGNLKRYAAVLRRRNRIRFERGDDAHASPLECCWPRLRLELLRHSSALLLGVFARGQVYSHDTSGAGEAGGGEKKLLARRGYPDEVCLDRADGSGHWLSVLSTVHPAYVLRFRRWTEIYRLDVAKARRMALGELRLREPAMVFAPRPAALRRLLEALDAAPEPVAYDTETDGLEPTEVNIRCIGIGNRRLVVIVPLRSVEAGQWDQGLRPWYTPAEEIEVRYLLRSWFGDESRSIVDQNGLFDETLMERHGFPVRRRRFDTAIGHHVTCSEWPHDLAFQGAQYTDALSWKSVDHDRWERDEDLWRYCAFDVGQTSIAATEQARDERLRGQIEVFRADMRLSEFCRGLHKIGMHVDRKAQEEEGNRLGEKMAVAEARARTLAGKPEMNVASTAQVSAYLFRECGVAPVPEKAGGLTDSGELSVDRNALLYLTDRGLAPELEEFVNTLIDYREAEKLRSNLCRKKDGTSPLDIRADGRVRPTWNPHVVVSGRLSSSSPNVMNVKGSMRRIFDAAEGHLLVACDKAQLELRIMAWLAQDKELVEAFLSGQDVHRVNACSVLGIARPELVTKAQRRFTKTFTYAVQYLAGLPKVHSMVKNYREPDGSRPWSQYSFREAETSYKRWWKKRRAVEAYHARNRELWKEQGYLESAILGRRRYFLDGAVSDDVREEMANYPIQSTAADDVNAAVDRVLEAFPWGFAGEATGASHYNYDSLTLETPAEIALEVGREVQRLMYSELTVPGIEGSMPLPVDLAIGPSWGELQEPDDPAKCKGPWWSQVDGARALGLPGAYA